MPASGGATPIERLGGHSNDPIVPAPSSPQALNRYSYCLGNPVRYSDPTGHAADAGGGAGLTIEELLAIYERLYNEAPDALDPKGYHGWLKEYYNRKAALYQQLVERRTPEEIEAAGAHVEQAYGNLLRNGYYGQRIGLAAAYDAAGGSSTVAFTSLVGFTELTRGVLIQQLQGAGGKRGGLRNPFGINGKADHQATVKQLEQMARDEYGPDVELEYSKSIRRATGATGLDRRPDVSAWRNGELLKVYEAARVDESGNFVPREQIKMYEYYEYGIPYHFEPVR